MTIVIVEDDKGFALNIAKKIKRSGYKTEVFNNVKDFKNKKLSNISLYIIDVGLPDGNGFELVKYLRLEKKVISPILIMSCYSSVRDKVLGLDIGADDYIAKPFSPDELIARIRALLRRPANVVNNTILRYNNIKLNLVTKEVFLDGELLHLPKKEKHILELLLSNKGEVISKSRLIDVVWSEDETMGVSDNTINATLSKLRHKLGDSFLLKTKVNEGYILD